MKIRTIMPPSLKLCFEKELEDADILFAQNNKAQSWCHLERAHIIGQPYPFEHTFVHWKMLMFGIKIKDTHEIIGQIPRLLVGGVKSFVGQIPVGNTGGADVPPLKAMEIPNDLLLIIQNNTK